MFSEIYELLDSKARSWWSHEELRFIGETEKARKLELASMSACIRTLRSCRDTNGGYASVGRGGWAIHYKNITLSGHDGVDNPMIQACILAGIPVIDSTSVPGVSIASLLRMPMIAVGRKPDSPRQDGKYGSIRHAPLNFVAFEQAELGATLYNFDGIGTTDE